MDGIADGNRRVDVQAGCGIDEVVRDDIDRDHRLCRGRPGADAQRGPGQHETPHKGRRDRSPVFKLPHQSLPE
jgi:hypothetical protein